MRKFFFLLWHWIISISIGVETSSHAPRLSEQIWLEPTEDGLAFLVFLPRVYDVNGNCFKSWLGNVLRPISLDHIEARTLVNTSILSTFRYSADRPESELVGGLPVSYLLVFLLFLARNNR
jgi:hypothetical protein